MRFPRQSPRATATATAPATATVTAMAQLALPLLLAACAASPPAPSAVEKAVWVSRFEYETAADIGRIMDRCAAAGFDSVMFQVRGNGTVLYPSRLEIWSEQTDFRSPGFDPLAHAIHAAHARGLRLHAWVNMLTGWRTGAQAAVPRPTDPRQLLQDRRGWFLEGEGGKLVGEGHYLWLNPCLPEVRQYLVDLCVEIAAGYPVDGIHLDYIRFPAGPEGRVAPSDARSRELFRQACAGRAVSGSPAEFAAWKAACVTELVRAVRAAIAHRGARPLLTAAVNADLARLRRDLMQDWPTWARRRLIDGLYPMNYTDEIGIFQSRSHACVAAAAGVPVVMGVGVYKHAARGPAATLRQLNAALAEGASGVSLFSYGSAFAGEWAPAVSRWNRQR